MTLLAVKAFNGLKPIIDPRLLDNSEAQVAQNVRLISGSLTPLRNTNVLKALTSATPKTIFRYGNSDVETNYWLEFAQDTDVMRSPIANDQYDRLYWTDGDNKPRYAPNSLILSGQTYPGASYELGIPAPSTAPSITSYSPVPTFNVVTREYVMTYYNPFNFKESVPSIVFSVQGVDGQSVAIRNLSTDNKGDSGITKKRLYRKVNGTYRRLVELDLSVTTYTDSATDASISSNATPTSTNYPIPTPTKAPILSAQEPTTGTIVKRVYMVTWSDENWTEGGRGPVSAVVNVVDGVTPVSITHSEPFAAGILAKRLYRQNVTIVNNAVIIDEAAWGLVATVSASTTSFSDTAAAATLTIPLPSNLQDIPATPTGTPVLTATIPAKEIPESRVYVYTYVSAYGEEGPPSAASASVDVDPTQNVTISMGGAPTGDYNVTLKRIYRSSSVGSRASYQFVAEVGVGQNSYVDSIKQANLGEVLPSADWTGPPAGLKGLRIMANGAAVGFKGTTLYLSEPNLPHAWPHEYPIDDEIVGIGTFGQSVAVLTKSYPYLFQGIDPAAMASTKLKLPQACVAKRSVVETGDGVVYASPDGLVSIGSTMGIITQNALSRDQWQAYKPSSMECYLYNGRVVVLYDNVTTRGTLIFDLSGQGAPFTTSNFNTTTAATAGYYDPRSDTLYFAQSTNIVRFDQGSNFTYTWRSKKFRLNAPENFSVAQVRASTFPVTFRLYGDGTLRHTQTVADSNPFRLPSGFRAINYEFEVESSQTITEVLIASSLVELKAT